MYIYIYIYIYILFRNILRAAAAWRRSQNTADFSKAEISNNKNNNNNNNNNKNGYKRPKTKKW